MVLMGKHEEKRPKVYLASQAYVVNSIGTHKEATWRTEA